MPERVRLNQNHAASKRIKEDDTPRYANEITAHRILENARDLSAILFKNEKRDARPHRPCGERGDEWGNSQNGDNEPVDCSGEQPDERYRHNPENDVNGVVGHLRDGEGIADADDAANGQINAANKDGKGLTRCGKNQRHCRIRFCPTYSTAPARG